MRVGRHIGGKESEGFGLFAGDLGHRNRSSGLGSGEEGRGGGMEGGREGEGRREKGREEGKEEGRNTRGGADIAINGHKKKSIIQYKQFMRSVIDASQSKYKTVINPDRY